MVGQLVDLAEVYCNFSLMRASLINNLSIGVRLLENQYFQGANFKHKLENQREKSYRSFSDKTGRRLYVRRNPLSLIFSPD